MVVTSMTWRGVSIPEWELVEGDDKIHGMHTCFPLPTTKPVNRTTKHPSEQGGRVIMVLVGDRESSGEGVNDLVCARLNAGSEITVPALSDRVLHREDKVRSVGLLKPAYQTSGMRRRQCVELNLHKCPGTDLNCLRSEIALHFVGMQLGE